MIRIGQQLVQAAGVELLGGRVFKVDAEPGMPGKVVLQLPPGGIPARSEDTMTILTDALLQLREALDALDRKVP